MPIPKVYRPAEVRKIINETSTKESSLKEAKEFINELNDLLRNFGLELKDIKKLLLKENEAKENIPVNYEHLNKTANPETKIENEIKKKPEIVIKDKEATEYLLEQINKLIIYAGDNATLYELKELLMKEYYESGKMQISIYNFLKEFTYLKEE